MADPLVDVTVRVYADVADRITLAEVLAVVTQCRTDLDTPSAAALPELVERLARQRLAEQHASRAAENGRIPETPDSNLTCDAGSAAMAAPRVREPTAEVPVSTT
jgi:hypothetical protein